MLEYNESDAFYMWLHICETLKFRRVYDHKMSKLCYHLRVVEEHLKCAYPEVYDQLLNQLEVDLTPVFTTTIATIFLADLQSVWPETVSHIFDVFLSDGESVIFTLIT